VGPVAGLRDGPLTDSQFGRRMRGMGASAQQIQQMFQVFRKKWGLDAALPPQDTAQFRPPKSRTGQLSLF
jgi:hypothetical protein